MMVLATARSTAPCFSPARVYYLRIAAEALALGAPASQQDAHRHRRRPIGLSRGFGGGTWHQDHGGQIAPRILARVCDE
jgi:hypothetical protein